MRICDYTKPELEIIERECNFTDDELIYFRAKARGRSNVSIATENYWSDSKVSCLARKVKQKINRI